MNSCNFIGRLVEDPKQYGEGDNVVSTFKLAVNRAYTNSEGEREADFPRFVAKGKLSHLTQKSLSKGTMIGVESHFQTRKVEVDGETKYYEEFVIERYTFVEKKR
ncbi:single-stranded DNA-binding protein [Peptococcaceae bacterium 1198_IL3148]